VTLILNLVVALMLQIVPPGQTIVVGLEDGHQLVLQNPEFSGFIEGRNGDAVLMYRQSKFHGEIALKNITRIDFHPARHGRPFLMKITLSDGHTLEVEPEHRNFVTVRGGTEFGLVTIKHPDPISGPVKLTSRKANRKNDLTIQFLEIPSS
jgi:hypothetical protein